MDVPLTCLTRLVSIRVGLRTMHVFTDSSVRLPKTRNAGSLGRQVLRLGIRRSIRT